jgi:hypothetical protein
VPLLFDLCVCQSRSVPQPGFNDAGNALHLLVLVAGNFFGRSLKRRDSLLIGVHFRADRLHDPLDDGGFQLLDLLNLFIQSGDLLA